MTNMLDLSSALEALKRLPIAVTILQNEKIIWVNQQFLEITECKDEEFVGLSLSNCDEQISRLFNEVGKIQPYETQSQQTIHLLCESFSLTSHQQVYVFHDMSEQLQLKEEIKRCTPKDSITGLYNKRIILENLDSQVTRSRRYGNPLALLRLSISGSEEGTAMRMKSVAEQLKDRLRWADCLGTLDENTILIILPETCLEEAKELAAKLLNDRAIASDDCTIHFGITAWQKGDDPARMLKNIEENQDVSAMALFS